MQCETHLADHEICLLSTTHLSIQGNSLNITSQVDSWVGKGVDQRTFGPAATPLPIRKPSRIPVEKRGLMQLHPQLPELRDTNLQKMVKIGSKSMRPDASIWKGMVENFQPQNLT